MKVISQLLHRADPYLGFDPGSHPQDLQGWGSDHPFFESVMQAIRPSVIFEVGTWKGSSAIHMAQLARQLGLDVEIVCIDTWLGSFEHVVDRTEIGESLRHVNGYPTLYYTFLSNVVAAGLQDCITPFPIASESAVVVLGHLQQRADLIYIDAAHEFKPAYRDISEFWNLLNEDGVMICDDYGYCDVTVAVCTFAAEMRVPVYATYGKALLSKKAGRPFHLDLRGIDP